MTEQYLIMRTNSIGLLVFALILLSACTKEGPAGPQGPAGSDAALDVHVLFFENPSPSTWSGSANESYRTTLTMPYVTNNVLLNGYVNVHFYEVNGSDTTFTALPFSVDTPLPVVTYTCTLGVGTVEISTHITGGGHQNPGTRFPAPDFGFRVAAIH